SSWPEGDLWVLGLVPMILLFGAIVALLWRGSFGQYLTLVAVSAVLMLVLHGLVELGLREGWALHFWIMTCLAATVVLPMLLRRLAREGPYPAASRARLGWVASALFLTGLNILMIIAYGILFVLVEGFLR